MATILDGNKVSDLISKNIKKEVLTLPTKPKLAVIMAGDNPSSEIYVRLKQQKARELGFETEDYRFDETVTENELENLITKLNNDSTVNAILVQLPLPKNIDKDKIINLINPQKDVDGFHYENAGKLMLNQKPYAIACTARGIMELLKYYNIAVNGKSVTVIGRSSIVGTPVARLMQNNNATVTVCHSKTNDIKKHTKDADIIVCALGKPKFLKEDMVKQGVVIIDVGINRVGNAIIGDVDFEAVSQKASYISPVPKGVGPMTIAGLMQNTLDLYKLQNTL